MKTFRRFQSFFLVCMMLFAMLPTSVFAASATCPYCDVTCSYTMEYEYWTADYHSIRHWCSNCGLDMCEGVNAEKHTFSNGVCTKCEYDDGTGTPEPEICYHRKTNRRWSGCDWYDYCTDCGEHIDSGTNHGSGYTEWVGCSWYEYCSDCDAVLRLGTEHGKYSYGDWEYDSSTYHRRCYGCEKCGEGTYSYEKHKTGTRYVSDGNTRHQVQKFCSVCNSVVSSAYESHNLKYGNWRSVSELLHGRSVSCSSCGYGSTETADHSDNDADGKCDACGYGMAYFSVTVPAVMTLAVSESGEVTAADNAVIINNSSSAIVVSEVTVLAADGWTIVPYDSSMADEKVDSNLIGFRIENIRTTGYGANESFTGGWIIEKGGVLPLFYDAVVSAMSRAVTDEQVLTVVFVIGWAA